MFVNSKGIHIFKILQGINRIPICILKAEFKTENKKENRKQKEKKKTHLDLPDHAEAHQQPNKSQPNTAQTNPPYPFVKINEEEFILILSVSWRAARRRDRLLPHAGSLPLLAEVTRHPHNRRINAPGRNRVSLLFPLFDSLSTPNPGRTCVLNCRRWKPPRALPSTPASSPSSTRSAHTRN
jgi:hypothetical protein